MTAITNWAGNVTFAATQVSHPASLTELRAAVATATRAHAIGSRHSFSPIADSASSAGETGTLISLDAMPAMIEPDSAAGTVKVGAGLTYARLAAELNAHGLALRNLASLPHITVAGACATGTHGSGDRNCSLAAQVTGLDLVTADGELAEIGGGDLAGSVVALGGLGVVASLTLQVVPAFEVSQVVYEGLPRAEFEANFGEIFGAAYSVSVFTDWRDTRRFRQVWRKLTADGQRPPARWFGATRADGQRHPVPGMPPAHTTPQGGVPGPWHERLPHFPARYSPSGTGDELQTEYLLPRQNALAALAALDPLAGRIAALLLICEIRTVAADDLWLSPCYQRDSVGLHFTWRKDPAAVRALLPAIEDALAPLHPRPHWGKVFAMPPPLVRDSYPMAGEFAALLAGRDPAGKFRNGFMEDFLPVTRQESPRTDVGRDHGT